MSSGPLILAIPARSDREQAFRRLVDERLEASYRLAFLLLGDRSAAEDATHDAILDAWAGFGRLRDGAAFDGWFRRILVNACRDARRQRRRHPTASLDAAPPARTPVADPIAAWAEREALERALRSLSTEHREVIVLRYHADLPLDRIATALDLPLGTVKSRLHHALRYLRAAYDAAGRVAGGSAR
jgi:RNA polymerase sigma-70 factor (ECF subfamily)